MKLFIACSKHFYNRIPEIKKELVLYGHQLTMPNCYDQPFQEERMKEGGLEKHAKWKAEMLRRDKLNLEPNDAILVLNFLKNNQPNYIGGATFLEMFRAWEMEKGIYLYNPIPECIFTDELIGLSPVILNGDLSLIPR